MTSQYETIPLAVEGREHECNDREIIHGDGRVSSANRYFVGGTLAPLLGNDMALADVHLAVLKNLGIAVEKVEGGKWRLVDKDISFGRYFRYIRISVPKDQIPPLPANGGPRWAPTRRVLAWG